MKPIASDGTTLADEPDTRTCAVVTTAVCCKVTQDQREALQRGEGVAAFVKLYPIEVVDFYRGRP